MNARLNSAYRAAPNQSLSDFAIKPLVLALSAALPLLAVPSAQAQTASRLPAVPTTALPKPAVVGWLVNGKAGDSAYNVGGTATNPVGTVSQNIPRAIYQWESFDVGVNSTMTFSFKTPDGASLNRVVGTVAPSQILGRLSSTVAGANGTAVTGGTVLLINQNGILFGPKSQVNTGSLIASTLNVGNEDFLGGFASTLEAALPTYVYDGGPSLYADPKAFNFVRVEQGAAITTSNGGQVFLFAQNVDNAGAIRTPGGQTVLAGGTSVFLNNPTNESLYASEVNPSSPATRGLLVEVNGAAGRVSNTGSIEVPRGNATLVGMAVNQSGRISATTSVSENGSIFLLARNNVLATNEGTLVKRAQDGGVLTLGTNSKLEITPDATPDAKGVAATATATTPFTASRVELSGRQIEMQTDATIVAPGGIVNARAESTPVYFKADPSNLNSSEFSAPDTEARLTMASGASINVSGTTGAEVSAARNFVATELLGANDLKDAPLQRNGPLYRSRITFDVRKAVPILGDTSSYVAGIARSAEEKMSAGGSVNLTAAGAVVLDAASKIDVSGGKLTYTEAQVWPSTLISVDGARYSPTDAPVDIRYLGVVGNDAAKIDRWGRVTQFGATPSRLELGYTEGKDAGTFNVKAPIALLGGAVAAGAVIGERQQAGTDVAAKNGVLELGARQSGGNVFGGPNNGSLALNNASGVLRDFAVTAQPRLIGTDLLNASSTTALPDGGWIAASTLNQSGAGTVRLTSYGAVAVEDSANLELPRKGSLEINASGQGGVSLGGSITARGGSVIAQTVDLLGAATAGGNVLLKAGQRIDVTGDFINQSLDGVRAGSAVAGGSVQLLSDHGLQLQDGSAIDVSGGATVNISGSLTGTNAGSITLNSETGRTVAAGVNSGGVEVLNTHIGASLNGVSLAGGGSLSLRAAEVDIREQLRQGPRPPIRDGLNAGSLVVDDDLFRQGGFTSFNIEGAQRLTVDPGVRIAPQASRWVTGSTSRLAPSGTSLAKVLNESPLEEGQRNAASVSLSSRGLVESKASGDLTLGAGAVIQTDAGGNVSLTAGRALVLDTGSRVIAPGGKVNLALSRSLSDTFDNATYAPKFEIRSGVVVDASGKTVLQPPANNLRQGRVFDGGSITLGVVGNAPKDPREALIDVAAGSVLRADGANDMLDVSVLRNSGSSTRRTAVHSAGGAINIGTNSGNTAFSAGGVRVAGSLSARSGGGAAAGGSLTLSAAGRPTEGPLADLGAFRIAITDRPLTSDATIAPVLGLLSIPAQTITNGQFADVNLISADRVEFGDNTALLASRSVTVNAPVISANAGSTARISAPGSVTLGALTASTFADASPPPLRPVTSNLQIDSGLVTFNGTTELSQIANFDVRATDSVRFDAARTSSGNARAAGSLSTTGNVTLTAPQTTVTTNTDFTVNALDKTVSFKGGDAASSTVLSAAGSLTVNAATIAQDGVVRVPFGRVAFNATESVSLGAGSLTSVSGDGMTVPYGSALGTAGWQYDGGAVAAPAEKLIALNAPGQAVNVQAGSKLGLAGGGSLVSQDFVAGPGGSRDVFTGALDGSFAVVPNIANFAPSDANIARLATLAGAAAGVTFATTGQQITIGAGSQLPAGTYAVLPARYALLPGAFLVTPSTNRTAVDAAYTLARPDGAQVVAGQRGSAGTNYRDALAQGYVVRTSEQAKQLSEVRSVSADAFFTDRAVFAAAPVPKLAQDAGSLRVEGNRMSLAGSIDFARSTTPLQNRAARGGEVDIAADRIVVVDARSAASTVDSGTLVLTAADINNTGAASVVLGGARSALVPSTGVSSNGAAASRQLNVSAREVLITNTANTIAVADLVVAAKERVSLSPGASIKATDETAAVETLTTVGDGALFRASADASASVVRSDVQQATGELSVGAGARLAAGALTLESTARTQIAADAALQAKAVTLGAPRIALGNPLTVAGSAPLASNTLLIGSALGNQVAAAESLSLRSFSGIDVYGSTTLGSATQKALALDAGAITVRGNAAEFNVQAGGVRIGNSSGAVAGADNTAATGRMVVRASGNGLNDSATSAVASTGTGEVNFGAGGLALQGVADSRMEAAQAAVFENKAALQSRGNLVIAAPRVVALGASNASATATGLLRVEGNGNAATSTAKQYGSAANLALTGARVEQAGTVELASGKLDLTATGAASNVNKGIEFSAGSKTLLAGRSSVFDTVEVTTPGGDLKADAGAGNIVIGNGVIDVSASGAEARAGSMSFVAKTGSVEIGGSLLARSVVASGVGAVGANSALGGKLSIDSGNAVNLAALATTLNREEDATRENFASSLTLRNRLGNQSLNAGSVLRASTVDISADTGSVTIAGKLDASGAQGGTINVAARDNVALNGELLAKALAQQSRGGEVRLSSRDGRVSMAAEATIDTSAAGASATDALNNARNGRVTLSATREGALAPTAAGNEVRVDPLLLRNFKGVDRIDVEAVKVYNYTGNVTVGGATASATALTTATIAGHNASFAGTNGAQANTILGRLTDGNAELRSQLHLRSGVEVRTAGDITVTGDIANSGWNLTPFAANGSVNRPGGEAMNLTLRAAGNLNVQASISDGFRAGGATAPTTAATASRILSESTIMAGAGSDLRLVAGADLTAASRLTTVASETKGDVVIGRAGSGTSADVIVRTTTGALDIAAGRDVRLLNRQAVAYTTGTPVAVAGLAGWVRPVSPVNSYAVVSGSTVQSPMLNGSGSVSVNAARDVLGAAEGVSQYGTNWWWRGNSGSPTQVISWWSRYDKFRQGFGSLGGGDVKVSAGRDAVDVQLAAGSSGYILPRTEANADTGQAAKAAVVNRFGAGSASLTAQRDVLGGLAFATGSRIDASAGNSIKAGTANASGDTYLQVLNGNSRVDVGARRDVTVGRVTTPGYVLSSTQFTGNTASVSFKISGLSTDARLRVAATAGDLDYRGSAPALTNGLFIGSETGSVEDYQVIPSKAIFASAEGVAKVATEAGGLIQLPTQTASLSVLARDSVDVGKVTVQGVTKQEVEPGRFGAGDVSGLAGLMFDGKNTPRQEDGASPVRFVSSLGDVSFVSPTISVQSTAPVRILAGRDVVISQGSVQAQHQRESDVSLINSSRDVRFVQGGSSNNLTLHGPGDLVVLAGRDVAFGTSTGFQATGNRVNPALPSQSANLTLVAGVAASDWRAAQSTYFHVLGGTGVAAKPGDLVAQLDATVNGLSLPGASSAAAKAFDALTVSQRVDGARQRVGDAAFDAALLSLMRQTAKEGQALTLAEARTQFDKQADAVKLSLVGKTLASTWAAKVAQPGQKLLVNELVAAAEKAAAEAAKADPKADPVAAAKAASYDSALRAFVKRRTGTEATSLSDAVDRFAGLPLEQQLIFTDQVLTAEVRNAGRAAAALSGEERDRAYAKAYDAIDAVFPTNALNPAVTGNVLMGSSQVKTLQGSDIAMFTPRGGVNVGELAAAGTADDKLGIVTSAGGGVSLIVRDNVEVNQSRVFTVGKGDLLMWAGQGNIDAGRGAKTVTGAPPPVYRLVGGKFEVDTSGSFSGSGIAVLNAESTLDLYAPKGEINAGDAGIKSLGNAFLGASRFVGADNLAIGGVAVGAPPPASTGGVTAALASLSPSALASTQVNAEDSEEEKERKRRRRLALLLEFLGFGEAPAKP
jgi:filamentous hemagglutinin family protein